MIEVLNVHKDEEGCNEEGCNECSPVASFPCWLGAGVCWDAAPLGHAGLCILVQHFPEPPANWILCAHPSLRVQLAGAGCGGIDPAQGIAGWRLSDPLPAQGCPSDGSDI